MKKTKKSLSPIAWVLIITTSIVAAAGVIWLVLKYIQKKREKCAFDECDCCDDLDSWDLDDSDIIGDLAFDDDELYAHSDDVSLAVDEAIDAVGAVSADIEDAK